MTKLKNTKIELELMNAEWGIMFNMARAGIAIVGELEKHAADINMSDLVSKFMDGVGVTDHVDRARATLDRLGGEVDEAMPQIIDRFGPQSLAEVPAGFIATYEEWDGLFKLMQLGGQEEAFKKGTFFLQGVATACVESKLADQMNPIIDKIKAGTYSIQKARILKMKKNK